MGLADWCRVFCAELQVKNAASISTRYKRITQRLNTPDNHQRCGAPHDPLTRHSHRCFLAFIQPCSILIGLIAGPETA